MTVPHYAIAWCWTCCIVKHGGGRDDRDNRVGPGAQRKDANFSNNPRPRDLNPFKVFREGAMIAGTGGERDDDTGDYNPFADFLEGVSA